MACFLFSTLFIVFLDVIAEIVRNRANGFIRLMPSHKVFGVGSYHLPGQSHYIAGMDNSDFYVGNNGSPGKLIKINKDLKSGKILEISAPANMKVDLGARLIADSSSFYLPEGIKPDIICGTVSPFRITKIIRTPFFMDALPITNESFIFRSAKHMNNVLVKENRVTLTLKENDHLLENQGDGIFSTDGDIVGVPHSNKLFYIYRYRNQITCTDTNLNLLYRSQTIDTASHANIQIAAVHSKKQITLASPPNVVNRQCSANEHYLFVNSELKADNETIKMHDKAAVIDVYSVHDGKYEFSFYLPDFDGHKMTDFKVCGNTLIGLFGSYLYEFHLDF